MLKCLGEMKVSDENEDLTIWNYNGDKQSISHKFRGCITNKENKIVCPSLGYNHEYTIFNKEECYEKIENIKDWSWFFAMEGTMVRLYFYKDKWYLSTHKKLCAFHSHWSCNQSFGEIFIDSLYSIYGTEHINIFDWFTGQLNKDEIYYFFLRSNYQNRIICHTSAVKTNERLVYIGRRSRKDLKFHLIDKLDQNVLQEIVTPTRVSENFDGIDDIFNYVENHIDAFMFQGIVGYCKVNDNIETIKIMNTRYKDLVKVRGNNHNLRFRYLEIRKEPQKVEKLYMLYPKLVQIFEDYEKIINLIIKKISKTYIDRYIQNKYITLPKEEFMILRKCNEWCKSKNEKFITSKLIRELIDNESPITIYKMINRFKMEESNQQKYLNYSCKKNLKNSFDFIESFYNTDNSSEETIVE
jgi:hypothetical protein